MNPSSKKSRINLEPLKKLRVKHWMTFVLLLLGLPLIARMPQKSGFPFIESSLWNLAFLIVLVTAGRKISIKKPEGWIWTAIYFYGNSFGNPGIMAWAYLAITVWAIWTWLDWTKNPFDKKTTTEPDKGI